MAAAEHENGRVASGDVEISYRLFGKPGRTPIVVNHGLSFFSYDWIGVAGALAGDRQVAAMDMRGFGDSSWSPSKDYSVDAFARDILAVMDRLGWGKAVLVGHSLGGRHATACAAAHPGRVAALVLVDYTPQNSPAGSKRVTETVAGLPDSFPALEAAMAHFGQAPENEAARARFAAYLRPVEGGGLTIKRDPYFRDQFRRVRDTGERPKLGLDMWEALGRVACPILALRARQSDIFGPETVDRVRGANPRLDLIEVDGGHNIPGQNPKALVEETRRFLDRQEL
jgi:esterase